MTIFQVIILSEALRIMHLCRPARVWRIGDRRYPLGQRTWLMAIINATPDSFYAGSRQPDAAGVVSAASSAVADGADVIDLGGESTRPGSQPVSLEEEQARLIPAIAAVRKALPEALISADTRHAATAERALAAGADIINDVTGLENPDMANLIARSGCGAVLMHHRGEFATMQRLPPLADPLGCVREGLEAIAARARAAGIEAEQIVLDPGFGFGKNLTENLPVLGRLDELHALGYPLLAGLSRKSFLRAAPEQGPEHRLEASLAAATAAVLAGAHLLRVHDVGPTRGAVAVADSLLGTRA
jgi:dihydropteroate synthase